MAFTTPFDIVIIGGGISGIVTARFYLDIHPECNLAMIERDGAVGGTWGSERLYPGFKAQASSRMCCFSDIELTTPPEGLDAANCPDSKYVAEYLDIYIDNHIYNSKSIRDRTHLNATVTAVRKVGNLWSVKFDQKGSEKEFMTKKIIVASGQTSVPNMPNLKGEDSFQGPIYHSLDFGRSWKSLSAPELKKVVILGGSKSAADMAYQFAKAGKEVSWIIRKAGKGPALFIAPQALGPYKNVSEMARTRLFAQLFLSGTGPKSWWDWFLWDTWPGQAFQKWFDTVAPQMTAKQARWDERTDAKEGFHLLKNISKPNFQTTPAGLVQYDDFWDTIAKNVSVYRKDIDHLEYHKIHFADGTDLNADALMYGTGYLETFPFLTEEDCLRLGLPHNPDLESPEQREEWARLEKEAEMQVIAKYPILAQPHPNVPKHFGDVDMKSTPFRLHNMVGPMTDQSIAFVGFATQPNMFEGAEIEGIWATAFLDGVVQLPDLQTMKEEVAWRNAYMRLRVPTYGRPGNFYLYESFPYFERLLEKDLGLKSWHHKTLWQEWTMPFLPQDYKGLKDEYLEKYGRKGES